MKYVLVGSKDQAASKAIRTSLASEYKVEAASSREICLEMFRKRRYEFLFMDVELLCESMPESNYKAALQPFWHIYPTAQIIAMSPQEMIREAVKAVKAGAGDYLTYPIDPAEIKYVTVSLYESEIMESELDYLRDRFWQEDSLVPFRGMDVREASELFRRTRGASPTP